MLTSNQIKNGFSSIGLKPGGILVLQSSYKGCGGVENGMEGLIDSLIEFLGPEGTLIMPAYNFQSWTEQHYFDPLETASTVGTITEIFRQRKDVKRTKHPVHSLSVWGKHANSLTNLDYTNSFGSDSVFAYLLKHDTIYATLGLGEKMPFLPCHFTEVSMNVSYRRNKDFGGIYLSEERKPELKVYGFPVRVNQKNPVFEAHIYLMKKDKVKTHIENDAPICYATAKDYHQFFIDYINEFPDLFTA